MTQYEYVATCLFGLEKFVGEEIEALGYERVDTMDGRVTFKGDINAIYRHSKQFQNNPVGNISSALNDAYLKANGTEGEISYGFIVDLSVAYYKTILPELFE